MTTPADAPTSTLTDRYVAATLARIPADQRADIDQELRGSIADAIDAALESGEIIESDEEPDAAVAALAAETKVLESLGDPERLAATYADRPLYLIGPAFYLEWKRLVILLLGIVVPIIVVLAGLAAALEDKSLWGIVSESLLAGFVVGANVVLWTTFVFAMLERYQGRDAADLTQPWTVSSLKEEPPTRISWTDTIATLVTLVITASVLVWQQVRPSITNDAGDGVPLINPDLWTFVLPALLVVMALEAIAVVVRHARGRWHWPDFWLGTALNIAYLALLLPPLLGGRFLNREFAAAIDWPDDATELEVQDLETWIAVGVVVVIVVDVWTSFTRTRRSTRR